MKKSTFFAGILLVASGIYAYAGTAANLRLLQQQEKAGGRQAIGMSASQDWNMIEPLNIKERVQSTRRTTDANTRLDEGTVYGTLNAPDGNVWTYVGDYERELNNYTLGTFKVYDQNNELVGQFSTDFELAEGETGINQAEINPYVTKKFFNTDEGYEIMLFVHATTEDYKGHVYNKVFSLTSGEELTTEVDGVAQPLTIEGNVIYAINTSTNSFSENFVLVNQVDNMSGEEYLLEFGIWNKAGYNGGPTQKHTFSVSYDLFSGSGQDGLPILINQSGNDLYYALAHYEKPYFVQGGSMQEDPVVTADNNLVITLYNKKFEEVSVTKIPVPMPEDQEFLYSFPIMGGLGYEKDLAFDLFSEGAEPAYIVTFQNYTTVDDYLNSYYVYNKEGERTHTIAEQVAGSRLMASVAGASTQYCFIKGEAGEEVYSFIDLPSCEEVANIPAALSDGNFLSTSMDRYGIDGTYQYAFALSYGGLDSEENVLSYIAWYDAEGQALYTDAINMGQNVVNVLPYIDASALNPYLFDTNDKREYMFLVKRGEGTGNEYLEIYNTDSEQLLQYGADDEKGGKLANIYLLAEQESPKLLCVYSRTDEEYVKHLTLNFTDLPLLSFAAGGEGTAENPYKIATVGDFQQIKTRPAAHYLLVNDLDFRSVPWGGLNVQFTGSLEGGEHVLSGLYLDNSGLFAYLSDQASVSNLSLYEPYMSLDETALSTSIGFIANTLIGSIGTDQSCSISNVHLFAPAVEAAEGFSGNFGGIAGEMSLSSEITASSVSEAVFTAMESTVGGITSSMSTGCKLQACYFSGMIVGGSTVGGIVASCSDGDESVTHCHVSADLVAGGTVGGIVAENSRSKIQNCLAEGTMQVTGEGFAFEYVAGGIVGRLESDFGGLGTDSIVANCLVGLTAIILPEAEEGSDISTYAHRIIGYSSGDEEPGIDYAAMENWTEDDWAAYYNEEKDPPMKTIEPEDKIHGNYVISDLAIIDAAIQAADNTTEGATLAADALTADFLTEHAFLAGTAIDAPWVHADVPYLWFENEARALLVDRLAVSCELGEEITLTFTLVNGDAENISITLSEGLEVTGGQSADADRLTVTVKANKLGESTVTARSGALEATSHITCEGEPGSGVDYVDGESLAIRYDGQSIEATGASINIYHISGTLVATGYDRIEAARLANGIYIVTAHDESGERAALKISVNNN